MPRPSNWKSPTVAVRVPAQYQAHLVLVAKCLERIAPLLKSAQCPFSEGDRVLVPFQYPDRYEAVIVTAVIEGSFYFENPDNPSRQCCWTWSIGAGVLPMLPDEPIEEAIQVSLLAQSLYPLFKTEFRTKLSRLENCGDV